MAVPGSGSKERSEYFWEGGPSNQIMDRLEALIEAAEDEDEADALQDAHEALQDALDTIEDAFYGHY